MDINGVVRYFKSVKDVSALYVFGASVGYHESGVGLGVLAGEVNIDSEAIDMLEQDCILRSSGPLSVVMLNTAPLYLKHYVASRGRVLFERDRESHINFTKRAIDEYSSVAMDRRFDAAMEYESPEFFDPFGDEEFLS